MSKSVPRVSSQGRKVIVQFTDTLVPNTTYTIDFADAIEDNNENNKLQGFTYSFSTGFTCLTHSGISEWFFPPTLLSHNRGCWWECIPTLQTPPSPPSPSNASQRQMTADASLCRVLRPENTASSPLQMWTTTTNVPIRKRQWHSMTSPSPPPPNASMPSTRCLTFLQGGGHCAQPREDPFPPQRHTAALIRERLQIAVPSEI